MIASRSLRCLALCLLLAACGLPAAAVEYRIEAVAEGLEHPW
jgi:hypothetical protein